MSSARAGSAARERLPSFPEFFEAVHKYAPFPWQTRLAERVLAERAGAKGEGKRAERRGGEAREAEQAWPRLLDLPTGTGKTSALDVALYALAVAPERMPRRIVLVVDRRIVVDQGAELARKLLRALTGGEHPAVAAIARRLRALWGAEEHEPPFAVAVMRGGMPRDNDWAKRPDQPVIGVSTIDQVGSRLLFRGYGVSARSASIHAGLLGNDTLILLDEVHLATAFAETLRCIRARYRKMAAGMPARFEVVEMSATPGSQEEREEREAREPAFALDAADRAHSVLRQRLGAHKPARLEAIDVRGDNEASKREVVAERVVKEALRLQREGAKVVGVVVNRVDTARLAWGLLEQHAAAAEWATDRLLVTGRMRPIDRDRLVREQLLRRAGAGRVRGADDSPLIVVATQCIEAGADLDFDGLVTECASLDALRQRFGRLDRRGEVTEKLGQAPAVILCRSDLAGARGEDPIYGDALAATWGWLQRTAVNGVVGFGIDELAGSLPEGKALQDLLVQVMHAPVLLPAHLDAWAHTSPVLQPSPDPDPALWLHGPARASSEVQVVWRADLEDEQKDGTRMLRKAEVVAQQLAQVRPSSLEAMTLPIHAVRAWLSQRPDAHGMSDVLAEGEQEELGAGERRERALAEQHSRQYLLPGREEPLRWRTLGRGDDEDGARGEGSERPSEEKRREGAELRPGDLVLVPASYGGINRDGTFDPASREPVLDLGDLAQLRGRGQPTLRVEPRVLACWALPDEVLAARPLPEEDELARRTKKRFTDWAALWPDVAPAGFAGTAVEWRAMKASLSELRWKPQLRDDPEQRGNPGQRGNATLVIVEPRDADLLKEDELADDVADALTEDDDSSFRATERTLRDHSSDVRGWAERFARQVGFDDKLVRDLALAGWLHDVGKADPRFQRWLVGGDEVRASMLADQPLAKSALAPGNAARRELARRRAGYPRGYRHELLSLAMIEQSEAALAGAHDRELVLHLVASHHGWCRPFAPLLDDPDELAVKLVHEGTELSASTRHRAARLDSGVAQRFWKLVGIYGWWGLAWLEAVMRLADHRASEHGAVRGGGGSGDDGVASGKEAAS